MSDSMFGALTSSYLYASLFAFGVVFVAYFLIFFWEKPFIVLAALMFIRPMIGIIRDLNFGIGGLSLNILGVFGLLIVAIGIFHGLINNIRLYVGLRVLFFYMLFVVVAAISLTYTPNIPVGVADIFKYMTLIVIMVLFSEVVRTEKEFEVLYKVIIFSGVLPAIYGFYQLVSGNGIYIDLGNSLPRIRSFFILPNPYAQFLVALVIVTVYAVMKERNVILRSLFILLAGIYLIQLYLTYTKTSLISIAACLVVYAICSKYRSFLLPIFMVLFVLFLSYTSVKSHMEASFTKKEYGLTSWQWRYTSWKSLITNGIAVKPVLGWGLGSSRDVMKMTANTYNVPHNDYLKLLVETGVAGFVPMVLFILSLFKKIYRIDNSKSSLAILLLLSWLIHMSADNAIGDVTAIMIIFSIIGATIRLAHVTHESIVHK